MLLPFGTSRTCDGITRRQALRIGGSGLIGGLSLPWLLELQAKARVHGDVLYRSLEMHVGAIVEGKLAHAELETASVVELKRASGG